VALLTLTKFVIGPGEVGTTVTVTVFDIPASKFDTLPLIVLPFVTIGMEAETNVTFVGNVSLNVIPAAASGPRF
jgi:hypothetical protein